MTGDLFGGLFQESDQRQSRRISELTDDLGSVRASLSQATRTASALRSDLASLRGSIETRLGRLSEAFDAFVELSSLRDQLALVAGPALVRQATRARLAALGTAAGDGGPVLDVAGTPAAPGYWLADALDALGPDGAAAAARAAAIDRRRTATFLTVAGAACGRADLVERWAADALGTVDPDHAVTRAQRALWVAAAEGHLGEDARSMLLDRLRASVGALPAPSVDETVAAWTTRLRRSGRTAGTTDAGAAPVTQVREAAASLAGLRALADGTGEAQPGAPQEAPGDTAVKELVAVLRALVEEGAEEERELMGRVAQLEAVVSGRDAPGPRWDAPAGDLLTLLGDDALGRRDRVGAVARAACAPWLLTIADTYLAEADVQPPDHLEATVAGVTLLARPTGAVDGLDEALAAACAPQHPRTSRETGVTAGAAGVSALLWVAALVDGTDLRRLYGVLAVALTVTAGALLVRRLRRTREDAARATRGADFVRREAQRLQDRVVEVVGVVGTGRQQAQQDHAHVVAAWGRPVTGTYVPTPVADPTVDAPADA